MTVLRVVILRLKVGLVGLLQVSALLLLLGWAWISGPPALATQWQSVAPLEDGQQQFVDSDSIQPLGRGRVRVKSYYLDKRQTPPSRSTYLTEYDCRRRWFRDVVYSGPVGQPQWQSVDPDRLNGAAMEYACAQAGYPVAPPSPGQN